MQAEDRENRQREVVRNENREAAGRHRWLWLVILLGCLVAAVPAVITSGGFVAFVLLYGVSISVWALFQPLQPPSIPLQLAVTLFLRGLLLFCEPALSDDVYRYRWDGRVAVAGINPYRYAPDDPRLAPLRDRAHAQINHPDIPTIYPPLAEAMFAVWALFGSSLVLWRLMLTVFDLLTTLILARRSPRAAFAWATCPLSIFELWNGHIDAAAALLLLVAVLAVKSLKWGRASALFAAAIAVKIVPAAALIPLVRRRRGVVIVAVAVLLVIASATPFVASGAFMRGFEDYAERWSFNSPLYALSLGIVTATGTAPVAKRLFTEWKDPLRLEAVAPLVYAKMNPEFFARALLGIALLMALSILTIRCTDYPSAAAHAVGVLILFSPTIHPWYWLVLLPLALLERHKLWIVLACAAPLSYLAYAGVTSGVIMVLTYLPALAANAFPKNDPGP